MEKQNTKQGKQFYVWVIFGISFLMVFTALGFGSSTKSTFLKAVTESLGLERSLFTLSDSLRYITVTVMSVFLGKTVKTLGLRRMAGFGFLFLALSFTVNSFANDYWMFYIGGILLGAGVCWTSTSMIGYLVENWFTNGKGTVMGILLSANGLGGFASEFIVTKIIYGADGSIPFNEAHWREGYRFIAALFVVVGIIAVIFIRNRPEDIGIEPAGRNMKKKKKRGSDWTGFTFDEIRRKPYFYISGICVFFTGFVLQAMNNVSKTYMYDQGLDKNRVIVIFASHSLLLMAAKILAGISYDRFGLRKTHFACCFCGLCALGSLCLVSPENEYFAWIYAIVSAFALPLETVMVPLTTSFLFGQKDYPRVLGYFLALNSLGFAVGVPVANLSYDIFNTYRYILIALTAVIALITIFQQYSMSRAAKAQAELELEKEKNE